MNVSSLNFLNLDSSVFGLLVLKNRFITVLAVGVVFVFIKLQILFVCVRAWVVLFLALGHLLGFWSSNKRPLQLYSSALSCEFFMWQTYFLVSFTIPPDVQPTGSLSSFSLSFAVLWTAPDKTEQHLRITCAQVREI